MTKPTPTFSLADIEWTIDIHTPPAQQGRTTVGIVAECRALGILPFKAAIDWTPGQERADVEALALQIIAGAIIRLGQQLAECCISRRQTGESGPAES